LKVVPFPTGALSFSLVSMPKQKEYILFITSVSNKGIEAVNTYNKKKGTSYKIVVLRDKNKKSWDLIAKKKNIHALLTCDFNKPHDIEKTLSPFKTTIKAATFYGDGNAVLFAKIVPHLPYINLPSAQSLEWSTDKIAMRQLFEAYDKTITPSFTIVKDAEEKSIEKIIKKVGFPLVIKPAGLAASLLVTMCYHEDELRASLKKVFKKIQKIYKENNRTTVPKLLVEQFMEGEMYSIDAYVSRTGEVVFCPLVYVKTGKAIGFDDFFGYLRITPTQLKPTTLQKAQVVAEKAIHAMNLRSTVAHIELMRTEDGWKVIELGPRIGGFRHEMYALSFGIDHSLNDLYTRLGEKPFVGKKQKAFVAVLNFYAKKEGILKNVVGLRKVKKLESFQAITQHIQTGQKCLYAKHGGKSVCNVTLSHKSRPKLLADIRRTEQMISIDLEEK